MKKLILLMMVLAVTTMTAQLNFDSWNSSDVVDDFGDNTGQTVDRLFASGTFSNSATADSRLTVKLVDYISDKILFLDFYEYNSAPGARLARSEYLYLHVKLENGSVIKLKGFASKGGGLVFSTKNYNKAKEILKSGNKMKCFISEGSTSSWSFVINKTN